MKTLILIRHAKSDWGSPSEDFHRPLAPRGITDAKLVAAKSKPLWPEQITVWSSAAKRASATARLFAETLGWEMQTIDFNDSLYTFDHSVLAGAIQGCPNEIDALAVFGHNPAITEFVNKFGNISIGEVPTSGLVVLTFDTDDWSRISIGNTEKVIFPSELRS